MLGAEMRHACRSWLRSPALAATAVLTLTLGIGANAAVFSVVRGILLRPLPYPDSDRLVDLAETNLPRKLSSFSVSALN